MEPKSIADQARIFGVEVPVLRTAKEVRDMGFTVLSIVSDDAVLVPDDGSGYLNLGPFKERTGYMFVMKGWRGIMMDNALEETAKEEDVKFLAEVKKAVDGK